MILNRFLVALLPFLLMGSRDSGVLQTTDPTCKSYYNSLLKKKVYTNVEIEPKFPGGALAYQRFLNCHLRYPQEQLDSGELQLTVTMKFIVNCDGQIINPSVHGSNTINETPFEKEVLRIIKLMPNWVPGICNGKRVPAEIKRPLSVDIEEEK
jgi:periplasmic protein TonB